MNKCFAFLYVLFSMCFLPNAGAQPNQLSNGETDDSVWRHQQVDNALEKYNSQFSGINSPIVQGYEYVPYVVPALGNAFFGSGERQLGTVYFDNKLYIHLPLLYDIRKDQIVLQSPNKLYNIQLKSEKIDWFTIGSHKFIHLRKTHDKNALSGGYYEQLVTGKIITLLAKRTKYVKMPSLAGGQREFFAKDAYFIKKDSAYYKVSGKRDLLKVMKDKRKELRTFLRKSGIVFNRNREAAMIAMIKYYERK